MFGGNCLPKLESMDSTPFSKLSWNTCCGPDCRPTMRIQRGQELGRNTSPQYRWASPDLSMGLRVKETGKAFIFSRQWEKQCKEGRFFQSGRNLLSTLRKKYDFTPKGRACWAGVARAGFGEERESMVCCGNSSKYSQDLWEEQGRTGVKGGNVARKAE